MTSKETAWIGVTIKHATPKAVLVTDSKTEGWIPRSQIIDSDEDLDVGRAVEIELPLWLAEKIGFT